MSIEQAARDAYTAYGEATGGKNYRGEPMPAWEGLGAAIQSAWISATRTAADAAAKFLIGPDYRQVYSSSEQWWWVAPTGSSASGRS